eukprot:4555559-Amphidinium_carterae.1
MDLPASTGSLFSSLTSRPRARGHTSMRKENRDGGERALEGWCALCVVLAARGPAKCRGRYPK